MSGAALAWRPLDEAGAREMVTWRYAPPYDVYDLARDAVDVEALVTSLTLPASAYYRADDEQGRLAAYCCFGAEAQVPGGDYQADAMPAAGVASAVDIGLGVRPDLTGRGMGLATAASALALARMLYGAGPRRVTIAEWNVRARRMWRGLGFRPVSEFRRPGGAPFVIYACEGGAPPPAGTSRS